MQETENIQGRPGRNNGLVPNENMHFFPSTVVALLPPSATLLSLNNWSTRPNPILISRRQRPKSRNHIRRLEDMVEGLRLLTARTDCAGEDVLLGKVSRE